MMGFVEKKRLWGFRAERVYAHSFSKLKVRCPDLHISIFVAMANQTKQRAGRSRSLFVINYP